MPGRKTPLVTGGYYHIFNRGSDKRDIYLLPRDYDRFQKTFYYYQFSGPKPRFSKYTKGNLFKPILSGKFVEILCFALMPNHFHFLVKQLAENGASRFMSQLCNSYTKYFNTKHRRIGPLLQGAFKAVSVDSDEQLMHVSRYIHLNPLVSGLVKLPQQYKWSSYSEYINNIPCYCSISEILSFFTSNVKYKEFTEDQIEYGTTLEILKHQLIDEDDI